MCDISVCLCQVGDAGTDSLRQQLLRVLAFKASKPPLLCISSTETLHAHITNGLKAAVNRQRAPRPLIVSSFLKRFKRTMPRVQLYHLQKSMLLRHQQPAKRRLNQHSSEKSFCRNLVKGVHSIASKCLKKKQVRAEPMRFGAHFVYARHRMAEAGEVGVLHGAEFLQRRRQLFREFRQLPSAQKQLFCNDARASRANRIAQLQDRRAQAEDHTQSLHDILAQRNPWQAQGP